MEEMQAFKGAGGFIPRQGSQQGSQQIYNSQGNSSSSQQMYNSRN